MITDVQLTHQKEVREGDVVDHLQFEDLQLGIMDVEEMGTMAIAVADFSGTRGDEEIERRA